MTLRVLNVAYPLATVSPDSVGGAEQVLSMLDRALVQRGHHSCVVACEGSRVAGNLLAVPTEDGPLDEAAKARAQAHHRAAIVQALARQRFDVVHLHGIDFDAYLPPPGVPTLATLHLPPAWYRPAALRPSRPDTWLHCVSAAQHAACPPWPNLLAPIENGVDLEHLRPGRRKLDFALILGRICPEKGVHLAIETAKSAGMRLVIAGAVFPYVEHLRYFREEIAPRLDGLRRFIGPVGLARKRRLLGAARCLLVPSLAPETSSLVAREAIACGTPVVAFPNGALADAVEHGRTGFLVADVSGLAHALADCGTLDPVLCRAVAERRFSQEPMIEAYLARYAWLADRQRPRLGNAA